MKLTLARPGEPGFGTDHEIIWPLVLVTGLVFSEALGRLAAALPVGCLLKFLSGLPCPGCGGTRAVRALLGLEPLAALAWNPLVAVLGALAMLYCVYAALALGFRTRRLRLLELSRAERIGCFALLFANWLYLIAVGR